MNRWKRAVLVTAFVGGGFAGIASTFQTIIHASRSTSVQAWIAAGFFVLYTFITASGLMFVFDENVKLPLIVGLLLQLLTVSWPGFAYRFAAGVPAFVIVRSTSNDAAAPYLDFEFLIGSRSILGWRDDFAFSIGINVFASVMLLLLLCRARGRDGEIARQSDQLL